MTETSIVDDGNWVLIGLNGPVKGREFVFIADEVRIGRTAENDIVIPEKSISRHHASFFIQGHTFFVQDMNSKNGTYINQQKVTKQELRKNDILKIGDAKFKVSKDEPSKPGPGSGKTNQLLAALSAKMQDPKQRRIILYAFVAVIFGGLVLTSWTSLDRKKNVQKDTTESTENQPQEDLEAPLKSIDATDQQVNDWTSQADAVLQYEDYNASLQLLRKVVAARPADLKAKSKLKQVEARLKSRISLYGENGAREFEKLNYDKAIMEWRIVLALCKGFDDDTYKHTGEKIREAEEKLKQKKR